ncbi:MAG: peptide chain release factor 1 [Clostridia bacterium]|nr:peptide chain release factor 1 [Clostridia bacterium]
MLDKLKAVHSRYEELCARSEQPDFYNDPQKAAKLLREKNDLEPIVETFAAYNRAEQDMADAQELMSDPEMKELCQEQFQQAKADKEQLYKQLQILLLPKDPNDEKSVIVEIRGGVGGEESALFAHSLFRMYSMYAAAKGWQIELMNYSETELGGVKEADFVVNGRGAWSRLKYESGVHRVQRVPETESGGRVHTSTATVAVLPEMEQVDVTIREEDVEMQVYRASGAGGQHVNKTSSAVRLIHKPTGIVVACQQERSQLQNREKCMRMLASKLYEMEAERIDSEVTGMRRSQVGTGMRNERIRTYNIPQGRVTDHRVGLTLYKIDSIMDGAIDEIIDALATADQAEKLKTHKHKTRNRYDFLHQLSPGNRSRGRSSGQSRNTRHCNRLPG